MSLETPEENIVSINILGTVHVAEAIPKVDLDAVNKTDAVHITTASGSEYLIEDINLETGRATVSNKKAGFMDTVQILLHPEFFDAEVGKPLSYLQGEEGKEEVGKMRTSTITKIGLIRNFKEAQE